MAMHFYSGGSRLRDSAEKKHENRKKKNKKQRSRGKKYNSISILLLYMCRNVKLCTPSLLLETTVTSICSIRVCLSAQYIHLSIYRRSILSACLSLCKILLKYFLHNRPFSWIGMRSRKSILKGHLAHLIPSLFGRLQITDNLSPYISLIFNYMSIYPVFLLFIYLFIQHSIPRYIFLSLYSINLSVLQSDYLPIYLSEGNEIKLQLLKTKEVLN